MKPYRGRSCREGAADNRIKFVNELDLEEYLLGVVPLKCHLPGLWKPSKAQAVAARTFIETQIGIKGMALACAIPLIVRCMEGSAETLLHR